jgi:microcystin-dependent protein
MKKILYTIALAILLATSLIANAQTNVTSSGMSIQGIARDNTNAALANIDALPLTFLVYYLGSGNSEVAILTQTANVKTDNFGVFSFVLDINKTQYSLISSQSAFLKVSSGTVVFSNEKLQAVPYAIFAQNGVPTGSIMPFVGTVVPNGWLLCNGATFPDNTENANLKALLGGTTTPNLQGMFLRGTGTAASGKAGPALKTVQQDGIASHLHDVNLNTNLSGVHNHNNGNFKSLLLVRDGGNTATGFDNSGSEAAIRYSEPMLDSGNHTHNVTGPTANNTNGITETRPINYGVNYIIKL